MLIDNALSRRTLLGTLTAASTLAQTTPARPARPPKPSEWKPRLGVLGPYSANNLAYVREEGFTNMILSATQRSSLDPTALNENQIAEVKSALAKSGLHFSAFQATQNHIAPDLERRSRDNDYFVKLIDLAGKLGIPYIGTASGKDPAKPFEAQVDDIVRVYNEKYFAACERNKVRILWEPWPEGPNIATSPVGFEALFKAFNNSPYVGLQYDPSHLVRQFMDPIQAARDFVGYIYDVHLKDTEIKWDVLKRAGINPVNRVEWWRYRIPGMGSIDWPAFFTVLQNAGYTGAMSVEHEDPLYGAPSRGNGPDFSDDFKVGLKMAHRYLRQYVPD